MTSPASRPADAHPEEPASQDVWIQDDRIVAPSKDLLASQEIDASGCWVMPCGIDMHTHVGGGKVTLARMLLRDQLPPWAIARGSSQTNDPAESDFLPSAFVTAERYLRMGYGTCLEPAIIPCNARSAHAEMADLRGIDTGGYCLLGNDDALLQLMAAETPQPVINAYVADQVRSTQTLGVKVVNAGGISAFKFNGRKLDVDENHPRYGITPGTIIRQLARAVDEIGLAHPLHVHASNLGVPGNIASTLATIKAASGHRIHITHAQFHSYDNTGPYKMASAAAELARVVNENPNVSIDVGQIQFGRTVTISADSMHQFENRLHAKPRKSIVLDIECEAGCGVVPFRYQRREYVHSLQWAIGLELFLMIEDPSRVYLTTDHPNGAPFTAYPHLMRLLGDRSFRNTALAEIHPEAAAASSLAGMDREYGVEELATMTRSGPAKVLGLADRGHLRPGGLADVVVYRRSNDLQASFTSPLWVIRRGKIMIDPDGPRMEAAIPAQMHQCLIANPPIDAWDLKQARKQVASMDVDSHQHPISRDEMLEVMNTECVIASSRQESMEGNRT
ncbi:MAG: formylmethanofuran dehydrogenase subunit A [Planctomycetota bacterium]